MHLPPAVSYEVVRSRGHFFMACALGALAIAVAFFFWMQQVSAFRIACLAGLAVLSSIASLLAWRKSPVGLLQWDGARWLWPGFGGSPVQSATVCVDLQNFVLFQLKSAAGKTVWLYLEERNDRARWLALRRAMVSWTHSQGNTDDVLPGSADVAT
jgi:hypothetical protein